LVLVLTQTTGSPAAHDGIEPPLCASAGAADISNAATRKAWNERMVFENSRTDRYECEMGPGS
jgi:hypothetical protein